VPRQNKQEEMARKRVCVCPAANKLPAAVAVAANILSAA